MNPDSSSSEKSGKRDSFREFTRRKFLRLLAGSSAGAMVSRTLGLGSLLFGSQSKASAADVKEVSFVLIGDFGAGHVWWNDGPENLATQNPNSQAVADGVKLFAPPNGTAYIVSLGDQIYEPYFGQNEYNPSYPNTNSPLNFQNTDKMWPAAGPTPYDQAIGELYAPYIQFPKGSNSIYANQGSSTQRFFAILGDHDWWHQPRTVVYGQLYWNQLGSMSYPASPKYLESGQPMFQIFDTAAGNDGYSQYFANQGEGSSSGNCRYYDVVQGNVHWFALSSDPNEVLLGSLLNAYFSDPPGGLQPDGLTPGEQNQQQSVQGMWFTQQISTSTSPWKFVTTHYPPFSSPGSHPSSGWMQWNYQELGVDAVFSGHNHSYERLYTNGVLYVVNGAGGTFEGFSNYTSRSPISQVQVTNVYGFLTASEGSGQIEFNYYSVPPQTTPPYRQRNYTLEDSFTLLSNGTLKTKAQFEKPKSILITKGGGTFDLNGFDIAMENKLMGLGTLVKKGSGSLRLAGANRDFEGKLVIRKGLVELLATDSLPEKASIVGHGGQLVVEGIDQTFETPLEVTGNFTIRLTSNGTLRFADSSRVSWGRRARLKIAGEVTPQSLRFGDHAGALTKLQLARIRFESHPHLRVTSLNAQGYLSVDHLPSSTPYRKRQEQGLLSPTFG